MNALIFLAHGSRRQKSNDEVRALVERMKPALSSAYDYIVAAFLELESPSFTGAIELALQRKATMIAVYPYFLNSGKHVERDIPEIIDRFENSNPDCAFALMQHFGGSPQVPNLVLEQILSFS